MAYSERVYTRIDDMLNAQAQEDIALRRSGYVHLYGVGLAAAIFALKRGFYPKLAEMAGMLHDYICYQDKTKDGQRHAYDCEPIARSMLVPPVFFRVCDNPPLHFTPSVIAKSAATWQSSRFNLSP